MFQAVVFDLDGVLLDSEEVNIDAIKSAVEVLYGSLTAAEVALIPGRSSQDIVPILLRARGVALYNDEATIDLVRRYYDSTWLSKVKPMPYARVVLAELLDFGKTLAIASTNRMAVIERFLAWFDYGAFFGDRVVSGEMVKRKKPDPEAYLLAAQKVGIPKELILAVEDTETGVVAAKAAGLKCAAMPNQYSASHDFSKADFLVSSLRDILPLCR